MTRRTKWAIVIVSLCLVVVAIGLIVYFCLFNKDTYRVVAVEHTTYQTSDFKNSELKLYDNGTFHLKIVYGEDELFFLGIGTYTKQNSGYTFTFIKAVGRQDQVVTDQTDKFTAPLTCPKSGNKIKFTDHNNQVYYFG